MPPFLISPLVKWALAAIGSVAIAHWAAREIRRVNEEIDQVRAAPGTDSGARQQLPTLRRDPDTGEWRVS